MMRLAPLSSRLDGFFMEARRGTRARPERGRPSVKSEAGGGGISVSELGVTAALGAALWRYRNIKTSNTLLLETKVKSHRISPLSLPRSLALISFAVLVTDQQLGGGAPFFVFYWFLVDRRRRTA